MIVSDAHCIAARWQDDIDVKVDCGKWFKKINELCPNTNGEANITVLPIVGWKEFYVGCLPPLFNYGNVYHWLVESKIVPLPLTKCLLHINVILVASSMLKCSMGRPQHRTHSSHLSSSVFGSGKFMKNTSSISDLSEYRLSLLQIP